MSEFIVIKKDVTFAGNGIMIQDQTGDYSAVVEYCSEGKHKDATAKHAIGEEIWTPALEVLGECVPEDAVMTGFHMEVILTPICRKEQE